MNRVFQILIVFILVARDLNAQQGIFENQMDIGKPKLLGAATFDKQNQSYHLKGGGYNIWFQRDEFQYAFTNLKGDFILTANFSFEGKGADAHRKIGWMVRESTDEDASHISALIPAHSLTTLQCLV